MIASRAVKSVLTLALLLVVATFAVQAFPGLIMADYAFTVQSGSMEPAIQTGSVVFVKAMPPESVNEGDVITYEDDGGNLITHRVTEKHAAGDSLRFDTKGDANEDPDSEPVYRSEYVGTVMFSVPFIGYIVAFGNTHIGYITLVLLPVMLLIFSELWVLYKAGMREDVNYE